MTKKKIVFLTGTRADFGKIKSLINITQGSPDFEVHIFVTGMHLDVSYGFTVEEIYNSGFSNVHEYPNHSEGQSMDGALAKTIIGFSHFIEKVQPDLVVVHGDRVEALAGALVGALNNLLVAHIEGGEVSGTIDESLRHAISKIAQLHLVANDNAKKRLIQLGEDKKSIFVIGSPDVDLMLSKDLPSLSEVKSHYDVSFSSYAIVLFHPVTTEYASISQYAENLVGALVDSSRQYIVIYPNNDLGSAEILLNYKTLADNQNFRLFPSLRFESFLTLLKHSDFIIGNSSAGVREAPYFGVQTVNIGTRQNKRSNSQSIMNVGYGREDISFAIQRVNPKTFNNSNYSEYNFGQGDSSQLFFELLNTKGFWDTNMQKQFQDIDNEKN